MEEIIKRPEWYDIQAEQAVDSSKTSFQRVPAKNVEKFVNFVYVSNSGEICALKTIKKAVTILKGMNMTTECRANTCPVTEKTPVIFEPDVQQNWPDDLEVSQYTTDVNKAKAKFV